MSTLAVASATYSSVVRTSGGANSAVARPRPPPGPDSMSTPSATPITTRLSIVCTWWPFPRRRGHDQLLQRGRRLVDRRRPRAARVAPSVNRTGSVVPTVQPLSSASDSPTATWPVAELGDRRPVDRLGHDHAGAGGRIEHRDLAGVAVDRHRAGARRRRRGRPRAARRPRRRCPGSARRRRTGWPRSRGRPSTTAPTLSSTD